MKATELFVEQLIIGIVVVLTAAVMVWPQFALSLMDADRDLSKAALVLIAAYLVGIVYDRVADSLLQDLERHHRLLFALGEHYKQEKDKETLDRFPEDRLRMKVMGEAGRAEHGDYLRSRIRLTRALTTLVPAIAMAAALGTAGPQARTLVGLTVLALYLLALGFTIGRRPRLPDPPDDKRTYALPRTDRLSDKSVRDWYERRIGTYDPDERRSTLGWRFALHNEPLARWGLALSAGAGFMGGACHPGGQALVAGGGVFLASVLGTALFGWSWWRISQTLYDHLSLAGKPSSSPPRRRPGVQGPWP